MYGNKFFSLMNTIDITRLIESAKILLAIFTFLIRATKNQQMEKKIASADHQIDSFMIDKNEHLI